MGKNTLSSGFSSLIQAEMIEKAVDARFIAAGG